MEVAFRKQQIIGLALIAGCLAATGHDDEKKYSKLCGYISNKDIHVDESVRHRLLQISKEYFTKNGFLKEADSTVSDKGSKPSNTLNEVFESLKHREAKSLLLGQRIAPGIGIKDPISHFIAKENIVFFYTDGREFRYFPIPMQLEEHQRGPSKQVNVEEIEKHFKEEPLNERELNMTAPINFFDKRWNIWTLGYN